MRPHLEYYIKLCSYIQHPILLAFDDWIEFIEQGVEYGQKANELVAYALDTTAKEYGEMAGELTVSVVTPTKFLKCLKPVILEAKCALQTSKISKAAKRIANKSWEKALGCRLAKEIKYQLKLEKDAHTLLPATVPSHAPIKPALPATAQLPVPKTNANSIAHAKLPTAATSANNSYSCPNHATHPLKHKGEHPIKISAIDSLRIEAAKVAKFIQEFKAETGIHITEKDVHHIFGPELICYRGKKPDLSGWHHDYMGKIKNTGIINFKSVKHHTNGVWEAW